MLSVAFLTCFVILVDNRSCYIIQDEVGRAIQKLFYPIRELTAGFPNHEVEIQLEVGGSQRPPNSAWRRLSHAPAHKSIVRSNNASQSTLEPDNRTATKLINTTVTIKTSTITENNSEKVPLYKNEFQKAISDLEKKILDTLAGVTSTTSATTKQTIKTTCPPPCNHQTTREQRLDRVKVEGQRDINRILEMLKKGVQVQYHLNQPMDPNLEWLQIKIPK